MTINVEIVDCRYCLPIYWGKAMGSHWLLLLVIIIIQTTCVSRVRENSTMNLQSTSALPVHCFTTC